LEYPETTFGGDVLRNQYYAAAFPPPRGSLKEREVSLLKAAILATSVAVLSLGPTLASAATNGDETAIVHPNKHHHRHHTQLKREPPGGLIQDRDERSSNGKNPEAIAPAK
jgi:hypothetical protein